METNGDLILRIRKSMRLSRESLGKILQIHPRTIARWEDGENEPGQAAVLAVMFVQGLSVEQRHGMIRATPDSALPTETL